MSWVTFIATYILLWWLFFFMALPWGNQKSVQLVTGQEPSAPRLPRLGLKAGIVSVLTLLCCLGLHITAHLWSPPLHQWLRDAPPL